MTKKKKKTTKKEWKKHSRAVGTAMWKAVNSPYFMLSNFVFVLIFDFFFQFVSFRFVCIIISHRFKCLMLNIQFCQKHDISKKKVKNQIRKNFGWFGQNQIMNKSNVLEMCEKKKIPTKFRPHNLFVSISLCFFDRRVLSITVRCHFVVWAYVIFSSFFYLNCWLWFVAFILIS